MASNEIVTAAGPLRELVSAVVRLRYSDPSFTVTMFAELWTVDVDAGESVDDVIRLRGPELGVLLRRAAREVSALPQRPGTPARPAADDNAAFLRLLSETRSSGPLPLDFSYVPRSRVSSDRPWEVTIGVGERTVVCGVNGQVAVPAGGQVKSPPRGLAQCSS